MEGSNGSCDVQISNGSIRLKCGATLREQHPWHTYNASNSVLIDSSMRKATRSYSHELVVGLRRRIEVCILHRGGGPRLTAGGWMCGTTRRDKRLAGYGGPTT